VYKSVDNHFGVEPNNPFGEPKPMEKCIICGCDNMTPERPLCAICEFKLESIIMARTKSEVLAKEITAAITYIDGITKIFNQYREMLSYLEILHEAGIRSAKNIHDKEWQYKVYQSIVVLELNCKGEILVPGLNCKGEIVGPPLISYSKYIESCPKQCQKIESDFEEIKRLTKEMQNNYMDVIFYASKKKARKTIENGIKKNTGNLASIDTYIKDIRNEVENTLRDIKTFTTFG
jgi:hypothetical protein